MQIRDILAQTGGLRSMANELGVGESDAAAGADALLPAILGGFKKQAQSRPAGLEGLGGLLGQLGGGGLLDDVLGPQPTNVNRGNDVLGEIFGSRDVSRAVAQDAASRSGLDPALLRKMLPMLAMVVGGFMARQHQGSAGGADSPSDQGAGGLGELLGGLFGGGTPGAAGMATDGALGRSGSNAGGLGGLASMLDLDGNGNPLDDILRMAGRAMR
jgi:hypothetical protein